MDIKELQIGDWLYSIIFNQTQQKKPIKVVGIRTDCDDPLIQGNDTDVWYCLETYEPIPLTEEILIQNGFSVFSVESKYTTLRDVHNISCAYCKESKEWLVGAGPSGSIKKRFVDASCIKYIHELQHILRLCGIDKEITIK